MQCRGGCRARVRLRSYGRGTAIIDAARPCRARAPLRSCTGGAAVPPAADRPITTDRPINCDCLLGLISGNVHIVSPTEVKKDIIFLKIVKMARN
eukprot:COSAG02_NODE_108_length_36286_cov_19.437478_12_plen_95_part_00